MNFWKDWFVKKYTIEEVMKLMDGIKNFNAGAIDKHLSKHVDKTFSQWKKDHS